MLPSRLRHPWDFYSKCIFLTLFFSPNALLSLWQRQCCKGRNCTGHEEGDDKPHPGQMVSSRLVLKVVMMPLGHRARQWPQVLMHTWPLQTHVLKPAQIKYNRLLYNEFLLFFRFSGGKTVCSPDLCLGQGTHTEGGVTPDRSLCPLWLQLACNDKQNLLLFGKEEAVWKTEF